MRKKCSPLDFDQCCRIRRWKCDARMDEKNNSGNDVQYNMNNVIVMNPKTDPTIFCQFSERVSIPVSMPRATMSIDNPATDEAEILHANFSWKIGKWNTHATQWMPPKTMATHMEMAMDSQKPG